MPLDADRFLPGFPLVSIDCFISQVISHTNILDLKIPIVKHFLIFFFLHHLYLFSQPDDECPPEYPEIAVDLIAATLRPRLVVVVKIEFVPPLAETAFSGRGLHPGYVPEKITMALKPPVQLHQ